MTEDQIERAVERKVDRLDAMLMANAITQQQYNAASDAIHAWAERLSSMFHSDMARYLEHLDHFTLPWG